jgi:S1-C subfamily serine protease
VFRVRNTGCAVLGTAFLARGSLFTNRHVAAGATSLDLSTWAGEDFTASVVGHSGAFDLASMRARVPASVAPGSVVGTDPLVGDSVYVAGYPEGNQLTVSSGQVLATVPGSRVGMPGQILVVSDQVKPGNSGSPLLDPNGKVVGVVFAEEVKTHYGLVIPASSLGRFLAGRVQTTHIPCTKTLALQPSVSSQ